MSAIIIKKLLIHKGEFLLHSSRKYPYSPNRRDCREVRIFSRTTHFESGNEINRLCEHYIELFSFLQITGSLK